MRSTSCKEKRKEKKKKKLTKARVLRKFVETLGLRLEKVPPLAPGGGMCWRLVQDRGGGVICPLYAPNFVEIHALGPRTDILDFLFNDVPWWFEEWWERDSGEATPEKEVVFVNNPVFGCKSLEEAMMKLDLLGEEEKPKI